MLDLYGPSINAFVQKLADRFQTAFPDAGQLEQTLLSRAANEALETLLNCDCPYHDVHHTMLVTDAGLAILAGRQLALGDLQASDWLHAVIAMLYHDIGYIRGLLKGDREGSYVADEMGNRAIAEARCDGRLSDARFTSPGVACTFRSALVRSNC